MAANVFQRTDPDEFAAGFHRVMDDGTWDALGRFR